MRKLESKATASRQGFVPAAMRKVYDAWEAWAAEGEAEHGSMSHADREKPALLNRLDWYSAHNWSVAYPGDPKIYLPGVIVNVVIVHPSGWKGRYAGVPTVRQGPPRSISFRRSTSRI